MPDAALRLDAPAKVNLGLHVLARRGDGYHEIDTLMAKLDLSDTLMLRPTTEDVAGTVQLPDGPGFEGPLAMDDDNLVVRAIRMYLGASGQSGGVDVQLDKRIPIAAGLGGGSSDAATALLGVARLYPAGVDLAPLALELGSDVPFFLQGAPAARARGRGEKLTPVDLPRTPLVLANPGIQIAAGEAYRQLQNFTSRLDPQKIAAGLAEGGDPGLRNALQPGVMLAHSEVRDALMALRELGLRGVSMSGSGATCFGVADTREQAAAVAAALAETRPSWWVTATSTASG
jgi:4-diphosphocytidyl-2-C-methyl-D-erythritol kinase